MFTAEKEKVPLWIILPVHNRKAVTSAYLECLKNQTFRRFRVLLVDDGSSDGTSEMAASSGVPLEIIRGNGRLWWAGGLQAGLDWLNRMVPSWEDPVIGFMNDDVSIKPEYLEEIMGEILSLGRGHALATPGVYLPSGSISWETYRCEWHRFRFKEYHRRPQRIHCASTRGFFMFRSDVAITGNFLPHRIPHYASDFEYTLRAHRKGIVIHPAAVARAYFHEETTGDHGLAAGNWKAVRKKLLSPSFSFQPVFMFWFILRAWNRFWIPVALLWYSWSLIKFLGDSLIRKRLFK